MTYGPPSEPSPAPQPQDPMPPQAGVPGQMPLTPGVPGHMPPAPGAPGQVPLAPMPAQPAMPPPPYADPRQQWANPNPYGMPATGSRKGAGPGVASLILGVLGIVLPFLPLQIQVADWRLYLALPLGLVGLVLAIVGCTGFRPGKPAAVVGLILSALALAIGLVMLGGFYHYSG